MKGAAAVAMGLFSLGSCAGEQVEGRVTWEGYWQVTAIMTVVCIAMVFAAIWGRTDV